MCNLFILGNGFDIAHDLPTKYSDFQKYLYQEYPDILIEPNYLLDPQTMPDGSDYYDPDEVVSFLIDIISNTESCAEEWSDLENTLGTFDYSELLDTISYITEGETNLFRKANTYEDAINNIYIPTNMIKELFSDWVNTISITDNLRKIGFNQLINREKDFFLTFNYTKILEDIYHVPKEQILHIHGSQDEEIVFGHGNMNRSFETYPPGSDFGLFKIHNALKKNTDKVISDNICFFEKLSNIKNIYSHGFSFAKVDLCYIREILRHIDDRGITWYLNDRGTHQERRYIEKAIVECGFKGTFNKFIIE